MKNVKRNFLSLPNSFEATGAPTGSNVPSGIIAKIKSEVKDLILIHSLIGIAILKFLTQETIYSLNLSLASFIRQIIQSKDTPMAFATQQNGFFMALTQKVKKK